MASTNEEDEYATRIDSLLKRKEKSEDATAICGKEDSTEPKVDKEVDKSKKKRRSSKDRILDKPFAGSIELSPSRDNTHNSTIRPEKEKEERKEGSKQKKQSRDSSVIEQGKKEAEDTCQLSDLDLAANTIGSLDKETEFAINKHYGSNYEELQEAKKIIRNIKSGSRNAIPKEKVNVSIKKFNKLNNSSANLPLNDQKISDKSKQKEINGPLNPGERIIKVNMIGIETLGEYKVSKNTTLAELRSSVSSRTGLGGWFFQDVETKKSIVAEEKRLVLAPSGYVIISNVNLEALMADAALHGSSTLGMNKDGSCSFRVLWWDSQYHTSRPVWLKFETTRITVTGVGGSFKLFDVSALRVPLIFAGVKGSERAFQFMKSRYSTRASRFFATNTEQKKAIGIYFCFVWRPQAIRKGWIREQDTIIDDLSEEDDPRKFANILRRHMIEVDSVIRDIEKNMDSRVVRKYIHLFAQMFTEGYSLKDAEMGTGEEASMANIRNRLIKWQDQAKSNQLKKTRSKTELESEKMMDKAERREYEEYAEKTVDSSACDEFKSSPFESNITNMEDVAPVAVLDPSIPPVPILPPPSAFVQKPAICPINFDGISAADIAGTIWAEMKNLKLRKEEAELMEHELKIIFGREARNMTQDLNANNAMDDGILDTNRVKNIEVLLHIEEIKSYSLEELIELILKFDPVIFNFNVLERLIRPINTSEGKLPSFLPSAKEVELLNEYSKKVQMNSTSNRMRLGEKMLLLLSKNVPDRDYRFNFGFTIAKYEKESNDIETFLDTVLKAEKAVRKAERFHEALRLVLEILNTLMPRYGFTRGFKISSFCSSVERVKGSVANPHMKEDSPPPPSSPSTSPQVQEADQASNKAEKIALILRNRKKNNTVSDDFWLITLPEYMAVYLSKFESCKGFWEDLIDVCEDASNVDQVYLDVQSLSWCTEMESIKSWYSTIEQNDQENNLFYSKVKDFLAKESKVKKVRDEVLNARSLTEGLWRWLGERMESEPHYIYKYIVNFCTLFRNSWNLLQSQWKAPRTKVLRGVYPLIPCKNISKDGSGDSKEEIKRNKLIEKRRGVEAKTLEKCEEMSEDATDARVEMATHKSTNYNNDLRFNVDGDALEEESISGEQKAHLSRLDPPSE